MSEAKFANGLNCAAIILAAGESARLGTPKQLLRFQGISLVRRAVASAHDAGYSPVLVVTGANAPLIEAELEGTVAVAVYNGDWKEGMASSIRAGCAELQRLGDSLSRRDGVLLLPCDLPFVTAAQLRQMGEAQAGTNVIVAAEYDGHLGPPVLFGLDYMGELVRLAPGGGARSILERHPACITRFALPEAARDIDTEADLQTLR